MQVFGSFSNLKGYNNNSYKVSAKTQITKTSKPKHLNSLFSLFRDTQHIAENDAAATDAYEA